MRFKAVMTILSFSMFLAAAENGSTALGDPVLEAPTLHSVGMYWLVQGDANANARVQVQYRKSGVETWLEGAPLFRVERDAHKDAKHGSKLNVPPDTWLMAGSILLLEPASAYEIKLTLTDPDGGALEKLLKASTINEPTFAGETIRHVVPGAGGGSGTAADPFKGLEPAQKAARAGDIFLIHKGTYPGAQTFSKSGETGKPIVWRGAGDGEAILDGKDADEKRAKRVIIASEIHDVWFEDLKIRNGEYGIAANRSARVVVRRCHISGCDYGLTCTGNDNDSVRDFFISDNVLEGPSVWPRSKGIENARGIQVTGSGHVVCYNRIHGYADAIDTFPSPRCESIDFHNNEISVMTDDGIELDYSQRNTRCFHNRMINVFQGITAQPVYGGPVYIFRNVMVNVGHSPFKLHNSPSGVLIFHNTSLKAGMPLMLSTPEKVRNCISRNNLFLGSGPAGYAYECQPPMVNCDFDYDGFGGGPWGNFLKWSGTRYKTLADVKASAPAYKNAVLVDPATAFASGLIPPENSDIELKISADARLKAGSAAMDAGQPLPGFNLGFSGKAPDLGAFELGEPLPHYGPRPLKR